MGAVFLIIILVMCGPPGWVLLGIMFSQPKEPRVLTAWEEKYSWILVLAFLALFICVFFASKKPE